MNDRELAGLLEVRNGLTIWARDSDLEARALGTTHQQHHVLLAVHRQDGVGPQVRDLADALALPPSGTHEIVRRMSADGLVDRRRDALDRRITRVGLTARGTEILHRLSRSHQRRLRELHVRNLGLLGPEPG